MDVKVSIITINFNNKDGLDKTINSVISQSYKNIQYIVIDGASTDGSIEVIKNNDSYIDYWISEPDSGIYQAMNKGVDKAVGDYLLFLNSGDFLHEQTIIEKIIHYLGNHDIVIGKAQCFPSGFIGWQDIILPFTLLDFYKGGPIPHPATFIKKEVFKLYRYDEKLKIVSDWKFFLQAIIFSNCSCILIDEVISWFEEGGVSSNSSLCEDERQQVLKELIPEKVRLDYLRFLNGSEYSESSYDTFFLTLRKYKYSHIVYIVSVLLIRLISIFKKSARFSRKYPLFYKIN